MINKRYLAKIEACPQNYSLGIPFPIPFRNLVAKSFLNALLFYFLVFVSSGKNVLLPVLNESIDNECHCHTSHPVFFKLIPTYSTS